MKQLERVFVALCSNLSPRGKHLADAREILRRISLGGWKESRIYETPPVGPPGQGPYLNQVVSFWYSQGETRLLHYLKGAELLLGRRPSGHWCAREIDMDLLYYGNRIRTGRPELPHKEIAKRQFVLVPMTDVDPDWMDPLSGMSVRQMLANLQNSEGVLDFPVVSKESEE